MFKKAFVCIVSAFLAVNLCGCAALLVGAASGAGTAVWLSGKLTQQVNTSFDRTIEAAKSGLKSLDMEVTKETKEMNVAQIKSKYMGGKTVWIDIRKISDTSSKIEIRVGAVTSDKEAADKILKAIRRHL
ncbi:MAG: DUF3568 family protein [Candidatus Omnitrophota bacterium]|jgi:predicted phage tail protein